MLKCIAIDDEPLALRQIESYIRKIPYLELTASCNNALEAQQFLAGQHADLIFVDINMPDLSGVEFVRSLVERPMVIFTTAYSEYAVEASPTSAVRRARPTRSTNCATTSVRPTPRNPFRRRCPKTRSISR